MADFCRQCSEELFGRDFGDLKGLTTEEDTKKKLYTDVVICEGCGFIQVNHLGECISTDCDKKGHKLLELFIYAPAMNANLLDKATQIANEYGWHSRGSRWQRTDGWLYQHVILIGGTLADKRRLQSAIRYRGCHSYTPNQAELAAKGENTCRTT
jgi:hypothetical protein